jgi:hypothetical protein
MKLHGFSTVNMKSFRMLISMFIHLQKKMNMLQLPKVLITIMNRKTQIAIVSLLTRRVSLFAVFIFILAGNPIKLVCMQNHV